MAIRHDNTVTLSHDVAREVAEYLTEYADDRASQAQRTRSATARQHCYARNANARRLASVITRALWTWENEPAPVPEPE